MAGDVIRAKGLDDARDALHDVADGIDRAIEEAGMAAARVIEQRARKNALGLGGVAAKSAPALSVEDSTAGAAVAIGGNAYPFALGAEFGSLRYQQFEPWRGEEGGYFLYPAVRQTEPQTDEAYEDAIGDLIKRAGLA